MQGKCIILFYFKKIIKIIRTFIKCEDFIMQNTLADIYLRWFEATLYHRNSRNKSDDNIYTSEKYKIVYFVLSYLQLSRHGSSSVPLQRT